MHSRWKNYLLNLSDPVFFDIMRNYLGELKTPFNKHNLIRSLSSMLSKKEIRGNILKLLDEDDIRLLTLVHILDQPTIDTLYQFIRHYYSFLELHNRIENLQERLLICIEEQKHLELNPLFAEELEESCLDTRMVFPSLKMENSSSTARITEQLISAFISFYDEYKPAIMKNGAAGKKARTAFDNIFTGLTNTESPVTPEFLTELLETLGLLKPGRKSPEINLPAVRNFSSLAHEKRTALLPVLQYVFFQVLEKSFWRRPQASAVHFSRTFPEALRQKNTNSA